MIKQELYKTAWTTATSEYFQADECVTVRYTDTDSDGNDWYDVETQQGRVCHCPATYLTRFVL